MRTLLVLGLVLGAASTAHAQELCSGDYSQMDHRWGIGLRSTGQTLHTEALPDSDLHMAGGGIFVRWRFAPHWGLELAAEGLHAEEDHGAYVRDQKPSTLAISYHFTPYRRWDWYATFGIGGTDDKVTYRDVNQQMVTEQAKLVHVQLGIGVERRWRHLGVGAELKAVGMGRDDKDEQMMDIEPENDFRAIPVSTSGAQLNIGVSYYF